MFKELNILEVFFESSTKELDVREVAKAVKITPATASKKLKKFAKQGILKYKKERILDLYAANLESDSYKDLKVYYSITKLRKSGLIEELNKFYIKPTVILFGSVAHGLDTETSDIDLVVVSERAKDFPEKEVFGKRLGRVIQIFAVKKLQGLRNPHLINSALNGIVLQGELQWT